MRLDQAQSRSIAPPACRPGETGKRGNASAPHPSQMCWYHDAPRQTQPTQAFAAHTVLVRRCPRTFYGCEACSESDAFDLIEEAIAPLRLKGRESKRLLRTLTCPCCESRVSSGMLVATPTPEQLRQVRLSRKFDLVYGAEVEAFRKFLITYPMLGAEHPLGNLLSKAIRELGGQCSNPLFGTVPHTTATHRISSLDRRAKRLR